jgi:chlorite dismutase
MLRDHGMRGAAFKSVLANTIAAFAISDYEWMLSFEADELTDLVDMMRDLRYTEARRHVREEVPFYAGRRIEPAELPLVLRYEAEAAE